MRIWYHLWLVFHPLHPRQRGCRGWKKLLEKGIAGCILLVFFLFACQNQAPLLERPNVLLFITDDQSFAHVSINSTSQLFTPAFDRVAKEGIWFRQAYAGSPGCSPSRAALLTGRHCWQLEAAGTHASSFPVHYRSYPELLAEAGYHVGFTGKGWGPGNWKVSGRKENPAGKEYNSARWESPAGISDKDYVANFEAFLGERQKGQPFCFWLGTHEPHRVFQWEIGAGGKKDLGKVEVPAFLPDSDTVRQDMLDYYAEIEWADQQLARVLAILEERGELDNTLLIVTSDNGMAFPRAKANMYDYGIHVPMALRWGAAIETGRKSDAPVGFVDLAPTILKVCGVKKPRDHPMSGRSLLPILLGKELKPQPVFSSRERHSSSRFRSLSYPQRGMRSGDYLLIWNPKPERWPAGAPQKYGEGSYPQAEVVRQKILGPLHRGGYHDIDACPTLDYMLEHKASEKHLQWAVQHRPEWELFDLRQDPFCLTNLAENEEFSALQDSLETEMLTYLRTTRDPRVLGKGDLFETYPRYSKLRYFPEPDWAMDHPEWVPEQHWENANPIEP
jgi:N-sulfoglucosamine sulfohydrolase